MGGDEQVGGEKVIGVGVVSIASRMVEGVGDEENRGVDPEDGEDAGEAMVEEDAGVTGAAESSSSDRGDHDAADDKEEIDTEGAVLEEVHVVGGAVGGFNAMKVG